MDNVKTDKYYAEKAINDIVTIMSYFSNETYEEFISDGKTLDAIMFRLVQLVENIKNISLETKEKYPNVPWGKIIGFRNGIVHEYGETDYTIVYEVVSKNLNELKTTLEQVI